MAMSKRELDKLKMVCQYAINRKECNNPLMNSISCGEILSEWAKDMSKSTEVRMLCQTIKEIRFKEY